MVEDTLKDRCIYNPETGEITWKSTNKRAIEGTKATSLSSNGYLIIKITHEGTRYAFMAHRVAWLLQTGSWPLGVIDHVDRDKVNNSWDNIRDCSQSQNTARRKTIERKLPRGVVYHYKASKKNPYMVQLKNKCLGYYATAEMASEAYEKAFEKEYGKEWRV